jgi:hypothetical protein
MNTFQDMSKSNKAYWILELFRQCAIFFHLVSKKRIKLDTSDTILPLWYLQPYKDRGAGDGYSVPAFNNTPVVKSCTTMYIFVFIVHKVNNPKSRHSMQQITSEHQIPRGIVYRL